PALMAAMVREFVQFTEGGLDTQGQRPDGRPMPGNLRRTLLKGPRLPFSGQVAVVTGAGSGIGRCAALALADQGAHVVAVDINPDSAARTAELVKLIGRDAVAERVDVGSAEQMQALAERVQRDWGGADIVINNAGIGMAGGMLQTDIPAWQRIIAINLWSVIYGARFFGQQMVAHGRGGHMVNTASAAAFSPSRSMPAYATTKAAVLMLSESLRGEFAQHHIGVSAVCPGFAETGIMAATEHVGVSADVQAAKRAKATKLYKMRGLQPETVATAMVRAIRKNQPQVMVGLEAHGARFMWRVLPWLSRRIARVEMV
ncbi:MAG: SDR family NAD(P)-dependent oxidoreductase, partial [Pseudomonadota bacterium]